MNIDLEKLKALKTLGIDLNDVERVEKFFKSYDTNTNTESDTKSKSNTNTNTESDTKSKSNTNTNTESDTKSNTNTESDHGVDRQSNDFNKVVIESINKLTEALQASNRLNSTQPANTGDSLVDIANFIVNGDVKENG